MAVLILWHREEHLGVGWGAGGVGPSQIVGSMETTSLPDEVASRSGQAIRGRWKVRLTHMSWSGVFLKTHPGRGVPRAGWRKVRFLAQMRRKKFGPSWLRWSGLNSISADLGGGWGPQPSCELLGGKKGAGWMVVGYPPV